MLLLCIIFFNFFGLYAFKLLFEVLECQCLMMDILSLICVILSHTENLIMFHHKQPTLVTSSGNLVCWRDDNTNIRKLY